MKARGGLPAAALLVVAVALSGCGGYARPATSADAPASSTQSAIVAGYAHSVLAANFTYEHLVEGAGEAYGRNLITAEQLEVVRQHATRAQAGLVAAQAALDAYRAGRDGAGVDLALSVARLLAAVADLQAAVNGRATP